MACGFPGGSKFHLALGTIYVIISGWMVSMILDSLFTGLVILQISINYLVLLSQCFLSYSQVRSKRTPLKILLYYYLQLCSTSIWSHTKITNNLILFRLYEAVINMPFHYKTLIFSCLSVTVWFMNWFFEFHAGQQWYIYLVPQCNDLFDVITSSLSIFLAVFRL